MRVGMRVRSLRPFAGVPKGAEGVVDSAAVTSGISLLDPPHDFWMIAWDLPKSPLPEGYARYDDVPAVVSGIVRDGFNQYELQWLEEVKS